MKVIYWRWKGNKNVGVNRSYLQGQQSDMYELSDNSWGSNYPSYVLKREVSVIKIVDED